MYWTDFVILVALTILVLGLRYDLYVIKKKLDRIEAMHLRALVAGPAGPAGLAGSDGSNGADGADG